MRKYAILLLLLLFVLSSFVYAEDDTNDLEQLEERILLLEEKLTQFDYESLTDFYMELSNRTWEESKDSITDFRNYVLFTISVLSIIAFLFNYKLPKDRIVKLEKDFKEIIEKQNLNFDTRIDVLVCNQKQEIKELRNYNDKIVENMMNYFNELVKDSKADFSKLVDEINTQRDLINQELNQKNEVLEEKLVKLDGYIHKFEEISLTVQKGTISYLKGVINFNMETQNYSDAIKHCKELLRFDEENQDVLHNLGWLYHEIEDYTNSEKYFKMLLKYGDEIADAYFHLALIAHENENIDQEIRYLLKAIEIDSSQYEYNIDLGFAYFNIEDYELSLSEFEKANALKPNHPEILFGLGLVYYKRMEYEISEEYLTKTLLIDDSRIPARYFLACISLHKDDVEEFYNRFTSALMNGWSEFDTIKSDHNFDKVRGEQKFIDLLNYYLLVNGKDE